VCRPCALSHLRAAGETRTSRSGETGMYEAAFPEPDGRESSRGLRQVEENQAADDRGREDARENGH
jgi:hypothetical protein